MTITGSPASSSPRAIQAELMPASRPTRSTSSPDALIVAHLRRARNRLLALAAIDQPETMPMFLGSRKLNAKNRRFELRPTTTRMRPDPPQAASSSSAGPKNS